MGLPRGREAKRYYRAGVQRMDDAEFLLKHQHSTAAVYLAGYAIECVVKALILNMRPEPEQIEIVGRFRTEKAHSYDWLRQVYAKLGGQHPPEEVTAAFGDANTWKTELRYEPGDLPMDEADEFFKAVRTIVFWAKGRM